MHNTQDELATDVLLLSILTTLITPLALDACLNERPRTIYVGDEPRLGVMTVIMNIKEWKVQWRSVSLSLNLVSDNDSWREAASECIKRSPVTFAAARREEKPATNTSLHCQQNTLAVSERM